MSTLSVFGEITSSNGESKYAYANAVTLTLLSKLDKVEGFENVKAPDIVNAGLVFLNLFFNIHIDPTHVEESETVVRELTFDEKEFKDFFNIAISHCKMNNTMLNDGIFYEGDEHGF